MQPTGDSEAQLRESHSQKVHPQPMEEAAKQNPQPVENLISNIFSSISSLKSAYVQLQVAHTPYDPDKIQAADKLVISELKNLSEMKHCYRENNPKPVSTSPQDSRLAAEIEEQQSLLKTYEVMVKKFQSEIQNKDSELLQLQQQIQEGMQRRERLEKNLKLRGLSSSSSSAPLSVKESENRIELTPDLFISAVDAASKAIHDFSKPLINMMKVAEWDLDAAANSIEPGIVYAKRSHKKYAFEAHICQRMFMGFSIKDEEGEGEAAATTKEDHFREFLALRETDPLDAVGVDPDSRFGKYCRAKYLLVVHQKMEVSFFGNSDLRNYITSGGHPRTPFYLAFLKLAKAIWLLQKLSYSFDPTIKIFQVNKGSEFSDVYMDCVVDHESNENENEKSRKVVGLMVMPGFCVGGSIIVQSRVYLTGMKVVAD